MIPIIAVAQTPLGGGKVALEAAFQNSPPSRAGDHRGPVQVVGSCFGFLQLT